MRRALVSAAILVTLGWVATVPTYADDTPTQDRAASQGAPAGGGENQKANQSLGNPQQSGRTEPSATNAANAHQASDGNPAPAPGPALVNGRLDVPGAPADSQTVPAKFSARNDKLDHTPVMAMRLGLTDEQKRTVVESVKSANQPEQASNAKPADELAWDVTVHDLGASASDPALKNLKYVRTKDRILLIDAPNRIVLGEIPAAN
jgi:hypothetical protein